MALPSWEFVKCSYPCLGHSNRHITSLPCPPSHFGCFGRIRRCLVGIFNHVCSLAEWRKSSEIRLHFCRFWRSLVFWLNVKTNFYSCWLDELIVHLDYLIVNRVYELNKSVIQHKYNIPRHLTSIDIFWPIWTLLEKCPKSGFNDISVKGNSAYICKHWQLSADCTGQTRPSAEISARTEKQWKNPRKEKNWTLKWTF